MLQLLAAISEADIQTSRSNHKNSESFDDFSKLFIQVEAQPIEFTTWGFYKINYNLLAGVTIETFLFNDLKFEVELFQIITGVASFQIILVQFHAKC
jgi:hypothetical protein